ncbi:hypothetical protein EPN95_03885 [Patescibacteria group bacterium]|nr:MAG: hypothetical protein EPN95_03885 [Patescibacteria group bacterium]
MDVDPKPLDPTPNTSDEPVTPIADIKPPLGDSTSPVNSSSPIGSEAMDEPAKSESGPLTPPSFVSRSDVPAKKSRRGVIGGIVIVIILIIVGLAWYVFYGVPAPKKVSTATTTSSSTESTIAPATSATNDATITSAVDSLSTSATDEATAAGTDDSSSATDASTTAGNVGDSVNANNF